MNEAQFRRLIAAEPGAAQYFRYVRPGGGNRGYWRRKAKDERNRFTRHPAKLRTQVAFGAAALSAYGKKGLPEGIPVAATTVRKKMKGKEFRKPPWEVALEGLKKAIQQAVEVTTET